jgi:hypothetical protein
MFALPARKRVRAGAARRVDVARLHGVRGGTVAGREDVTVTSGATGLTISASGRLSGSLDIIMRRAEVRYRPDWTPEVFELEALVNGGDTMLRTTFSAAVR